MDTQWLFESFETLLETLLGVVLIFVGIVAFTRITGLRSFAKFTVFDFAFTVAVGSVISSTLTSSTTVAQGLTAIFGLLGITYLASSFQRNSQQFDRLISNQPLLLMKDGEIIEEHLAQARVSRNQVIAKLREANALKFSQVKAVILETTGDISVLHHADEDFEIDERLLDGVEH